MASVPYFLLLKGCIKDFIQGLYRIFRQRGEIVASGNILKQ